MDRDDATCRFEVGTRNVWVYWETPPGREKPAHIQLCHESIAQNCATGVRLHMLGPDDIDPLGLDLHPRWRTLQEPAHRADYLRVALLAHFGGIWLDSDTIAFRPYSPIADLLDDYDFVAWEYRSGTDGSRLTYRVPVSAFGVRPGSPLMRGWMQEIHKFLDSAETLERSNWHALGRRLLNPLLKEMVETGKITYRAFHAEALTIPIKADAAATFFTTAAIGPYVKDSALQPHISYFNSWMPRLRKLSRDDLLSGNTVIAKLFQYAMRPDRRDALLSEGALVRIERMLSARLDGIEERLQALSCGEEARAQSDSETDDARCGQLQEVEKLNELTRRVERLAMQLDSPPGGTPPQTTGAPGWTSQMIERLPPTTQRKVRKLTRDPGRFIADWLKKRKGRFAV